MIKETVKIKLTDNLKNEVMGIVDSTINKVMTIHGETLEEKEINKIKNLTLDQINVNVTTRANLKTLWVLNVEDSLPVIVEKELGTPKLGEISSLSNKDSLYKMKPNLTWTFNKKNKDDGGVDKQTFKKTVIDMLLEDVETAAFYGALSYVGDVNGY